MYHSDRKIDCKILNGKSCNMIITRVGSMKKYAIKKQNEDQTHPNSDDGFVMSDFIWGVKDTVEAANGGQNMEMCCTQFFGKRLVEAVQKGQVPESKIDDAALRIIRTLLAFHEASVSPTEETILGCKEHVALALQSAREGITLIKNENHVLPLNKKETKKVVVLGKLGEKEVIGDHGSSQVHPAYVITRYQGINKYKGYLEKNQVIKKIEKMFKCKNKCKI